MFSILCRYTVVIPPTESGGVRQSELVNWYLKEVEEEIESVEELSEKKLLVEKIIERLVQHVSLLAVLL